MPPNRFESEVGNFLEGSHGDRTHIKRAGHHTVTPLCGTLLWVPLQSWDRTWTDEELYKKYSLTETEIAYIESLIRPMDLD